MKVLLSKTLRPTGPQFRTRAAPRSGALFDVCVGGAARVCRGAAGQDLAQGPPLLVLRTPWLLLSARPLAVTAPGSAVV
eukprot:CAMPEP_0181383020 /NCGR_PEP_ID=MMETSP1106-20121128/21102_1 /TAXON_ID=81844 /ORGANISM="Mantoniella antarctica, Strain SL-175" /LENGTH=78 /DNA_ID=CAMNT_0023502583 /DNA_START=81 /DNA_END=314 /DNA_ORIENTATION=+